MQSVLNKLGASVLVLGMFGIAVDAFAVTASGRSAYNVAPLNRAGVNSMSSQRMPTMPTLPGSVTGNMSPNVPGGSISVSVDGGDDNPGGGDNPGGDDKPGGDDVAQCPDGGVRDSDYTIQDCMNDVLACVNNGALPGGLNDMFDEDVRNSIISGMGLCVVQVERCVEQVRRDCQDIYKTSADVWIDFNARKVQPEYYNFVLRKTGLTPVQAENTCMLLDRNVYGSSFTAVNGTGGVTSEYNQTVGAYNQQQGNALIKSSPMGVTVNSSGITDAQRGHYARWDAKTAECWVRVAAYNKDTHIKNSWLFGAAGNDQPAEVWRQTGSVFTCNRDLFGFSLMNQTNTAAVVGIGGGALLGAGVGALAGHGERAFDCSRENHRKMLTTALRNDAIIGTVNRYLDTQISVTDEVMSPKACQNFVKLYDVYATYKLALDRCLSMDASFDETIIIQAPSDAAALQCAESIGCIEDPDNPGQMICDEDADFSSCGTVVTIEPEKSDGQFYHANCSFQGLDKELIAAASGGRESAIFCSGGTDSDCRSPEQIQVELRSLDSVFDAEIIDLMQKGEESNMGAAIGIGVGVGAGAGGLATAITAFVERSNINCRVGDGLAQVGYGKSYSIESLRDFYVKWGLTLPDTIAPTGTAVKTCTEWQDACGLLTTEDTCQDAQMRYSDGGDGALQIIDSACEWTGGTTNKCTANQVVAISAGACTDNDF